MCTDSVLAVLLKLLCVHSIENKNNKKIPQSSLDVFTHCNTFFPLIIFSY